MCCSVECSERGHVGDRIIKDFETEVLNGGVIDDISERLLINSFYLVILNGGVNGACTNLCELVRGGGTTAVRSSETAAWT